MVRPAPPQTGGAPPQALRRLQRSVGNRTVAALMRDAGSEGKLLAGEAEEVWRSLKELSDHAIDQLTESGKRIHEYLERYDEAWEAFSKRLEDAKEEAERQNKWNDALKGVVIGVGIGVTGELLYEAEHHLGKLIKEVVMASAHSAGDAALEGDLPANFNPPNDLSADHNGRLLYEKLVKAWEATGILQNSALRFSDVRDALRDAAGGHPTQGAPHVTKAQLGALREGIREVEQALKVFAATVDTPLLDRDARRIEQDLWIRWIARQRGRNPWGYLDLVGEHLRELQVLSGDRNDRLTVHADTMRGIYAAADAEIDRLGTVGHLGVVVVPPHTRTGDPATEAGDEHDVREQVPGIVKLRHDAYGATDRYDPDPQGPERFYEIAFRHRNYLRTGEVVEVTDTLGELLVVRRVRGERYVSDEERSLGLKMLGLSTAYEPMAATVVESLASAGVSTLKDGPPYPYIDVPIDRVPTEDGQLLSSGAAKLLLIAPVDDEGWPGLERRRRRSGAKRVMGIEFDPMFQVPLGPFETGVMVRADNVSGQTIADELKRLLPAPVAIPRGG